MNMRRFVYPIAFAFLLWVAGASAGAAPETIRIRPGFQRVLPCEGPSRISVGNPAVLEAQPLTRGDGILLVGKSPGETDLVVWNGKVRQEWRVEVTEPEGNRLLAETVAFASAIPGLTVAEAGSSVILSGEVPDPSDRRLLESFAASRPSVLLRLRQPPGRREQLSYDLKIMEIGRGSATQLGVRLPDAILAQGSLSSPLNGGSVLAVVSDFEARIHLLMAEGKARILANPRLVCESGEAAEFLAGGEIPIVIVTPESRTVQWKTYGIILKLSPILSGDDLVRTKITAEISTVDHASGSGDVPAFLTRRVSTHFSTAPGGTVLLSGLVKNEAARDVSRVPLLGQIPVLGELFRSRNFRENQTELAIFITPSIARGDASGDSAAWQARIRKEEPAPGYRHID